MAVLGQRGLSQIGVGRFEFHIAAEGRSRRTHQRIQNVIADARDGACANQVSFAYLCSVAAHRLIVGIRFRQAHFRPGLERRPADAIPTGHIALPCAAVIEEIELDQLDALVFEIQQRAGNAAKGWSFRRKITPRQGRHVPGSPVLRPVHPWRQPELQISLAAADSFRLRHLA